MEQEARIIYSQQFTKEIEREGNLGSTVESWKKATGHRCFFFIDKEGRLYVVPAYPSPPPPLGEVKG